MQKHSKKIVFKGLCDAHKYKELKVFLFCFSHINWTYSSLVDGDVPGGARRGRLWKVWF